MNREDIKQGAARVWRVLNGRRIGEGLTLARLARMTNMSERLLAVVIGWMAREHRVVFNHRGSGETEVELFREYLCC